MPKGHFGHGRMTIRICHFNGIRGAINTHGKVNTSIKTIGVDILNGIGSMVVCFLFTMEMLFEAISTCMHQYVTYTILGLGFVTKEIMIIYLPSEESISDEEKF